MGFLFELNAWTMLSTRMQCIVAMIVIPWWWIMFLLMARMGKYLCGDQFSRELGRWEFDGTFHAPDEEEDAFIQHMCWPGIPLKWRCIWYICRPNNKKSSATSSPWRAWLYPSHFEHAHVSSASEWVGDAWSARYVPSLQKTLAKWPCPSSSGDWGNCASPQFLNRLCRL